MLSSLADTVHDWWEWSLPEIIFVPGTRGHRSLIQKAHKALVDELALPEAQRDPARVHALRVKSLRYKADGEEVGCCPLTGRHACAPAGPAPNAWRAAVLGRAAAAAPTSLFTRSGQHALSSLHARLPHV